MSRDKNAVKFNNKRDRGAFGCNAAWFKSEKDGTRELRE
jgi:hypothetical protein